MASTMSTVSCPTGQWTVAVASATAGTITLQNRSVSSNLLVRIDGAAVIGDADSAAADIMYPNEFRTYTVKAADVVMLRPSQATGAAAAGAAINVTLRV
jgi:hypothetical protein